jgi:HSP20 family protein
MATQWSTAVIPPPLHSLDQQLNKTKTMYHSYNTAGYVPATRRESFRQFQSPATHGFRRPKYNVPMNITEANDFYTVEVFASGFSKENITLRVVEDILYIKGRKEVAESPNFTRQEFPIKNFERTLVLNGKVDTDNISAKSENGVLIIMLHKTPGAQKKEQIIEVR